MNSGGFLSSLAHFSLFRTLPLVSVLEKRGLLVKVSPQNSPEAVTEAIIKELMLLYSFLLSLSFGLLVLFKRAKHFFSHYISPAPGRSVETLYLVLSDARLLTLMPYRQSKMSKNTSAYRWLEERLDLYDAADQPTKDVILSLLLQPLSLLFISLVCLTCHHFLT